MTQEFHLSVTPVGADQYLVRTEQVAPGVPLAEEQFIWPVEDWLNQARHLLNDPLMGVLQEQNHHRYTPEQQSVGSSSQRVATVELTVNLVSLGQQLYNALFQGTLRDSWMTAQGIANHRGEGLRLRLGLKCRRLARLPWEVMHAGGQRNAEGFRPLATGTDVVFSRYQPNPMSLPEVQIPVKPLSILMAIAAPTDQETLELEREAYQLQAELQTRYSNEAPEIQLTILSQPDREQLTRALEQGHYQVFHYAGHSNLGASGGDIYLVSGRTGLTEKLSGDDLAGLLANNGIRMAVFNSCRGADAATSDWLDDTRERNLAEALVKRGIPGVLAMAERIPDQVALTLSQLFYRNLKQGYPVDLSLSRARQGLISAYGSHQLYWALPILFLQPGFDGRLTDGQAKDEWEEGEDDLTPVAASGQELEKDSALHLTEAISSCIQTIAANPNDFEAYNFLGSALYQQGQVEDAIASYREALKINPYFADAHNNLGVIHYERGNLAEAIASYRKALEIDPRHNSANNNLNLALHYQEASELPSTETAEAVAAPTPVAPVKTPVRPSKGRWFSEPSVGRSPILWGIGLTCLAVAIFGIYRWNRPVQTIVDVPQIPATTSTDPNSSESLTAKAAQSFRQSNLAAGVEQVNLLLDREVLNFAQTALAAVPDNQTDDPKVAFVRGRLTWQAIQKGDENFSLDDARRSWELAVRGEENNPLFRNALGFAYYAEKDFNRANQSWLKTLELLEAQSTTEVSANREALTAYAGLALVLMKLAQNSPPERQGELLAQAVDLHRLVIQRDPVNFQPQALAKNWLWTEAALKDWVALSNLNPS